MTVASDLCRGGGVPLKIPPILGVQFRKEKNHGHAALPKSYQLELELIQSHMAQKPMLRGEVGARALRVWSDVRGHAKSMN